MTPADAGGWERMRAGLWPETTPGEHEREIADYFAGRSPEPGAVLLAEDASGHPLGFAELSLRPCAEGCTSRPVAYLEGWWVEPHARRQGVGRALIRAAEGWGRAQGCTEFASDTGHDNDAGAAAHRAAGFADVGLVRCFRKLL